MSSENWPTYVLLALYVAAMISVATYANMKNRNENKIDAKQMIRSHFLANKTFGGIILLMTTFASVFSGYTVVGVPNEAGVSGFTSIRWLPGILWVAFSFMLFFPRLRRISMIRGYDSPGDFIYDRFHSIWLRLFITFSLCIPQLFYLAVQLHSLGSTLSNLTNDQLNFYTVVIVSSIMIVLFEIAGGLRSVAYTDAVQASLMLIVFIAVPIVLGVLYGGFKGMVTDFKDLPCDNHNIIQTADDGTDVVLSGCLNYANGAVATDQDIVEQFYLRMPSSITIGNYLLFTFALASFALNPHVMQRVFSASKDWQVKFVVMVMFASPFITMIPGVLMGISYISNYHSFDKEYQGYAAFQAMLGVLRDEGGFVTFISYLGLIAGVAGIMSTADSALIGVSNTVSVDIFRNWLLKIDKCSPIGGNSENTVDADISRAKKTVLAGKIVSIITMIISLIIAIDLEEESRTTGLPVSYGELLTLQQGILWQAVPSFLFGLYTNVSSLSMLTGIVCGLICDIILVSLVYNDNDPFVAADPKLEKLNKAWASLIGVAVNLVVVLIVTIIFGSDPNDIPYSAQRNVSAPQQSSIESIDHVKETAGNNSNNEIDSVNIAANASSGSIGDISDHHKNTENIQDDDILTITRIRILMKGIDEPIFKYYGILAWMVPITCIIPVLHWIGEIDPSLYDEYSKKEVEMFEYNGKVQNVIAGMPTWTFATIIWCIVGAVCGVIGSWFWTVNVDNEYARTVATQSHTEMDECDCKKINKHVSTNGVNIEINGKSTVISQSATDIETHKITSVDDSDSD